MIPLIKILIQYLVTVFIGLPIMIFILVLSIVFWNFDFVDIGISVMEKIWEWED
jgi:hypothetical protein